MPLQFLCHKKYFTEAEVGAVSEIFEAACVSSTQKDKKKYNAILLSFVRNICAVRNDAIVKDAKLGSFSRVYNILDNEVYYEAVIVTPTTDGKGMDTNHSSNASDILLPHNNS